MRIKLGIMTSEIHMDYLSKIESEFKSICDMRFFIINHLSDVNKIYKEYREFFDGFIFSGPTIHSAIKNETMKNTKFIYILYDEISFFKEFVKILINNPNTDLSRIYLDYAYLTDSYEEIKDMFPKDKKPYFLPASGIDIEEVPNTILNNHINLWEENKIDFSITAFGYLVPELKKREIKHFFIYPLMESVRDTFKRAINEITISKLNDIKTVVAYISIDNQVIYPSLNNALNDFFNTYNFTRTIQLIEDHFEIYTTYKDFLIITNDIKNCSLLKYINDTLYKNIEIGWGFGGELYQARENAIKANKQAKAYGGSCSFYIDESQKVTGPLQGAGIMEFHENAAPEIIVLAEKLSINNINLQKIISYAGTVRTNKFSSEDIAQKLSMTVRGANRILNKIEEMQFANIVFEKRENTKGRPKKYYELIFLDEGGNLIK